MRNVRWVSPLVVVGLFGMASGLPAQGQDQDRPTVRFETTQGVFRVELYAREAPRLTRTFLRTVASGTFQGEGFWQAGGERVQLGTPQTDVDSFAARDIRSGLAGSRVMRDADNIPFLATQGAHGFEFTGLPPRVGSFMIDQRFIVGGQFVKREYFVALQPDARQGEVIGQVITGLDVLRKLTTRDALRRVSVE